jgi:hypothetical protein
MKMARSSSSAPAGVPSGRLLHDVRELILATRERVASAVNAGLVMLYWQVGQRIRKDIMQEKRAEYGQEIFSTLSRKLVVEFGQGFSQQNLFRMARFAEVFPEPKIVAALSQQLGWSHFVEIIPLKDPLQREFYAEMCRIERWSVRRLGYAFHNGRLLFERLAERMHQKPGLHVLFHVDVPRKPVDTSLDEMIVLRFAEEFRRRHWPWQPLPEVYYDPRALRADPSERASLHAKVIVVDRQQALITSANFTEAAQRRNIEVGILSKSIAFAEKVAAYFAALRETGTLRPIPFSPRPD